MIYTIERISPTNISISFKTDGLEEIISPSREDSAAYLKSIREKLGRRLEVGHKIYLSGYEFAQIIID